MKISEIKNELWSIGKAYPTLAGLLQKPLTEDKTVGQHWAELLSDCDGGHLVDVCEEFATLKQELPQPSDQLVFVIKSQAKDREYRDQQRWEQHVKYHQPRKRDSRDDELGRFFTLFDAIRRQPCEWRTKRQAFTDQQMDEALGWVASGEGRPEWCG